MIRDVAGLVGSSIGLVATFGHGLVSAIFGSPELVVTILFTLERLQQRAGIPIPEGLLGDILAIALAFMFFTYLIRLGTRIGGST